MPFRVRDLQLTASETASLIRKQVSANGLDNSQQTFSEILDLSMTLEGKDLMVEYAPSATYTRDMGCNYQGETSLEDSDADTSPDGFEELEFGCAELLNGYLVPFDTWAKSNPDFEDKVKAASREKVKGKATQTDERHTVVFEICFNLELSVILFFGPQFMRTNLL